jgi:hypothetical protein
MQTPCMGWGGFPGLFLAWKGDNLETPSLQQCNHHDKDQQVTTHS